MTIPTRGALVMVAWVDLPFFNEPPTVSHKNQGAFYDGFRFYVLSNKTVTSQV
jgi:hypothetical protein